MNEIVPPRNRFFFFYFFLYSLQQEEPEPVAEPDQHCNQTDQDVQTSFSFANVFESTRGIIVIK